MVTAKPRLLCVDDEPELLDNIRLVLRKRFDVSTAQSGPEALAMFEDEDTLPFDAVVSDMRMPEMSGAVFLTTLRERHPEVPRLLLTGQSDLDSAIAAINDAKIFRFLTKPCAPGDLIDSIDEAVRQARLEHIERELLDRTLSGMVDMLTDVVGLVSPEASGRASTIRNFVSQLSAELGRPIEWELDLAAMLSQLGFVAMPLQEAEEESPEQVERRVELAAELLIRIPRLEGVAALIRGQLAPDPVRVDEDSELWTDRELNAESIRLAAGYERLVADGCSLEEACQQLLAVEVPPPAFLAEAIGRLANAEKDLVDLELGVRKLQPGMILAADLHLSTGPMLAPAGVELTTAL
ncbi:MAG: response regulator, partial [Actinomycetota bacterium]